MRRSCVHVYVHFVWRTWDSLELISKDWERRVHACIAEEAHRIGCAVLRVGGTDNHVHILVRLGTTVSVAQAAKQMKGGSSHFVTHAAKPGVFFKWQGTYGAFSVNPADIDFVIDYIARQREHHAYASANPDWERCDEIDPGPASRVGGIDLLRQNEHDEQGWPSGFFDATYGSLADDPLERLPQGEYEVREPLE